MASRSNDRINMIIKIISSMLDMDEAQVKEYVLQSETGQEILDKNQVVLHDQVTANVYDILMELSETIVAKQWNVEDIARIYNSLIMDDGKEVAETKFMRLDKGEKRLIRKKRKEMERSMREDWDSKKRNARVAAAARAN